MARPTKEQVAAREAAKQATAQTDKQEPVSKRSRIDPREYAEKFRRERKSISGFETRLAQYGENPGWKRRWVNDDNVPQRLNEGYRFVMKEEVSMSDSVSRGNDDVANAVSQPVGGTNSRNEPRRAFLMEIPLEMAKELDYEKSGKQAEKITQSILRGNIGVADPRNMRLPDGVENQYGQKA